MAEGAPTSRIIVITCGGTIDKDYPRATSGYAFEFGDEPAVARVLQRAQPLCVHVEVVCPMQKDSTEMTSDDRETLRALLTEAAQGSRAIITHGTDTMIETARFLHAPAAQRGQTVVLTGAMRPERFTESDAHFNLGVAIGAVQLLPAGAYVCMNGVPRPALGVRRCEADGRFEAAERVDG